MKQGSAESQAASREGGLIFARFLEGLARAISLTVEVFLHRGFGARYINCGFIGIPIIFIFAQWFPGRDPHFLYGYMVAYGLLWLIFGISVLKRRWGGKDIVHSRYTGRPYLWRLLPSWKEENVKILEALAVILLGYGIHFLNRPLGDYLMVAAGLLFLRGYGLAVQQRDRVVAMNDRAIEQKLIAERFRDMQEQ